MAGIDRTTIITGPCQLTYNSVICWSKGDVTLKPVLKRFNIDTATFGKVDERIADRRFEVSFEPAGVLTTALAAVMWPYGSTAIGASIIGATDKPLAICGKDGTKVTMNNAALTGLPSLTQAVDKQVPGTMTFTCLIAKSTDPTNAAAYYTITSTAYPADTGFAVGSIPTLTGAAVWGASSPWNSFLTEAGFQVDFSPKFTDVTVDGMGTVDLILSGMDVTAKAIPVGPTVANILAKLPAGNAFGTSLGGGDNLVITSATGGAIVTLTAAALVNASGIWGDGTKKRIGECEWIATRTFTANAPNPLFTVTVAS